MKKVKKFIPLFLVLALALSLFCVNRYNTSKRHNMALDTIRTGIINYVFAGEYESEHLRHRYVFTFVDENTVKVKCTSQGIIDKYESWAVTQDFDYRIVIDNNEFKLKIGKPKNEISTVYKASKLSVSNGTFVLTDYSYEGEDVHRAVSGIRMYINDSITDTVLIDLKTPDKGSKTIMLPGDIRLD